MPRQDGCRSGPWNAALAMTALLLASAAGADAQPVTYSHSADTVVASLVDALGEIGEADRGPSVRIHGDGTVLVHYPRYMQRAGDYTLRLEEGEMNALLASLVGRGLLSLDADALRLETRRVAARATEAAAEHVTVFDASTTTLELRVNGVEKRIAWHDLARDAARHPGIRALQDLEAAARELRALMERVDLRALQ